MQKDRKRSIRLKKQGRFESYNVKEGEEGENFRREVTQCQQVLKVRQNNALQVSKDLS